MLIQGNALDELRKLDSESIDCCITSPPYYALRDYKVEGQLGLEPTFQLYLDHLIQIFIEVKRVLKKSGTCWVVMGDTYASGGGLANEQSFRRKAGINTESNPDFPSKAKLRGLLGKSLLMIPSRFAISMIDNGWILRNDIIWHKPNCMPSSAKDRFTVDYEHIFFFVKSKQYTFKTQFEPIQDNGSGWNRQRQQGVNTDKYNTPYNINSNPLNHNNSLGRIKRTVWKIPPKPFPEAHFAVFPEELVRQCLDAGCPTFGTVLDPFSGAGTTYKVALEMDRKPIGIELNPEYIEITRKRISPLLQQTKITSLTN